MPAEEKRVCPSRWLVWGEKRKETLCTFSRFRLLVRSTQRQRIYWTFVHPPTHARTHPLSFSDIYLRPIPHQAFQATRLLRLGFCVALAGGAGAGRLGLGCGVPLAGGVTMGGGGSGELGLTTGGTAGEDLAGGGEAGGLIAGMQ